MKKFAKIVLLALVGLTTQASAASTTDNSCQQYIGTTWKGIGAADPGPIPITITIQGMTPSNQGGTSLTGTVSYTYNGTQASAPLVQSSSWCSPNDDGLSVSMFFVAQPFSSPGGSALSFYSMVLYVTKSLMQQTSSSYPELVFANGEQWYFSSFVLQKQ